MVMIAFLRRLLRRLGFGSEPPEPASDSTGQDDDRRYDNVKVISMTDGTTIEGHDAVKAHFEREQAMLDEFGSSLIFQVYRFNSDAENLDELQGERLAELTLDPDRVTGEDTVAAVKQTLRPLLQERARSSSDDGDQPSLTIAESDHIALFFNGSPMENDRLFYADHFMMLPAWVQVLLHRCEFDEVIELLTRLSRDA